MRPFHFLSLHCCLRLIGSANVVGFALVLPLQICGQNQSQTRLSDTRLQSLLSSVRPVLEPIPSHFVVRPLADQSGDDVDGDGTFDRLGLADSSSLLVTRGENQVARQSSAIEFALPVLPEGTVVRSAELALVPTAAGLIANGCSIYGYEGDGKITLDDLTNGEYLASVFQRGVVRERKYAQVGALIQRLLSARKAYAGFRLTESTGLPWRSGLINFESSEVDTGLTLTVELALPAVKVRFAAKGSERRLEILFHTTVGRRYSIQTSLDLKDWTTVLSGIQGTGTTVLVDKLPFSNVSEAFVRVVLDQP